MVEEAWAGDVVHAGRIIRDAVALDLKNPREEIVNAGSLFAAVDRLFALLYERRILHDEWSDRRLHGLVGSRLLLLPTRWQA